MKKNTIATFCIISLIAIAISLYGQVNNTKPTPQLETPKYIYCELWEQFQGNLFGSNTTLSLNFGAKSTYQKETEESSYVKKQKDVVDALNFMSENGWELTTKTARTLDMGVEVCYLLRKKSK